MARISTYTSDTSVEKTDRLIGSNSSGGTKNFAIQNISAYLRASNSAGVGGQLVYVYHDATNNGFGVRQPGTITFDNGGASTVTFSSITTIKISKYPNSQTTPVVEFLTNFLDINIIISNTENQNQFAVYYVETIAQDVDEPNFYDLGLVFVSGNGGLQSIQSYSISAFKSSDKNFVTNNTTFLANTATTITHNLGKFPAVTVVDSAGTHVVGDVQHINVNSLTITVKTTFTGKIYVN